jgi:hypothetical protein
VTTRYYSTPAVRSYAPAKTFRNALEAHRHARGASAAFRVAYAVWELSAGRLVRRGYFPAPRRRA